MKKRKKMKKMKKINEDSDQRKDNTTVEAELMLAADLFEERDELYGETYLTHGNVMSALFPNGIKLESASDFTMFNMINIMASKMNRLSIGFEKDSIHLDSLVDLASYSAMAKAFAINNPDYLNTK